MSREAGIQTLDFQFPNIKYFLFVCLLFLFLIHSFILFSFNKRELRSVFARRHPSVLYNDSVGIKTPRTPTVRSGEYEPVKPLSLVWASQCPEATGQIRVEVNRTMAPHSLQKPLLAGVHTWVVPGARTSADARDAAARASVSA